MRNSLSLQQFAATDSVANGTCSLLLMTDSSLFEQNAVLFSLWNSEVRSWGPSIKECGQMHDAFIRNSVGGVNWADGSLSGSHVKEGSKAMGQLRGIFRSQKDWSLIAPEQVVYRVQWILPVEDGTEGGLYWGNTTIEPGRVGDEYFMTHGHFHSKSNRAEFYATVRGTGYLVLMDRNRKSWAEPMSPGSIHYVAANVAHRAVNCGDEPLRFVACWPSDAGHDYESIADQGFSIRVVCRDGAPSVIAT
jgi:glucose-6-phosphate isomerase, archaeal